MTNLIEGILKDFDEEFGSGSNLEQFSSTPNANDFSIHQQNSTTPNANDFSIHQQNLTTSNANDFSLHQQNSYTQQQSVLNEAPQQNISNTSFKYQLNNTNSAPQFNSYTNLSNNNILSENTFQEDEPQIQTSQIPQNSSSIQKINKISVEEATQIINDLKKERIKDAKKMQQLQTENARLVAKMTILEHTDLKVAELGSRVEQLLQKYLETEQIRAQQAAQISQLRQEVIVLKSKISQAGGQIPGNQRSTINSNLSNY